MTNAQLKALIVGFLRARDAGFTHQVLRTAKNLFDAGLDSLGFIELIEAIEDGTGISFTTEQVATLSRLSVDEIAAIAADNMPLEFKLAVPHVNRILQCFDCLPTLIRPGVRYVLVFGSSGVVDGIDPVTYLEHLGSVDPCVVLNLGFPNCPIPVRIRIARKLAEVFGARQVTPLVTVLEFDPMGYSELAIPMGAAGLNEVLELMEKPAHERPAIPPVHAQTVNLAVATPEWDPSRFGSKAFDLIAALPLDQTREALAKRRQLFDRRRNDIAAVYAGEVPFPDAALQEFLRVSAFAAEFSQHVLTYVCPISPDTQTTSSARGRPDVDHFAEAINLLRRAGANVLRHDAFDLTEADFMDGNHISPLGGSQRFSEQLARATRDFLGERDGCG